jgi:cell division protein FtsX
MKKLLIAAIVLSTVALGLRWFVPTLAGAVATKPKPPHEVSPGHLPSADADVEVFMEPDATVEQSTGVRQEIQQFGSVVRFAYVSQQAAYRELKRAFHDQPAKAEAIDPTTLRPSFRLALHHKDQSFSLVNEMKNLPGVNAVTSRAADELSRRCRPPADMEVFMKADATADEVTAVGVALQADDSVATVRSISKQKALKIFRCLHAENPELAEEVHARDLPASFTVTIRHGEDLQALKQRAELLNGVDEAIRGPNPPAR